MQKGPLVCPAPIFVPDGQFCVCKDDATCPSTAKVWTPAAAAELAAEYQAWHKSGGVNAALMQKVPGLVCPAPIFVAEGQFCVCKDDATCPSTAKVWTPAEAASVAAEYQAWHKSGGVNAFMQKGPLVCPAPIFVPDGQFCVCKDDATCPSTAKVWTPEEAASVAAEYQAWHKS